MEIVKHSEETKRTVQPANETTLMELNQQPGREVCIEGKKYLFFSGYAYLGMHGVPEFSELVKAGMENYGWNYPSARISNTPLSLYNEFEKKLSAITGFEHSISVASGYAAGRMAIELFKHKGNFLVAPGTHPSVAEGIPQYKGSFDNWAQYILTTVNTLDQYSMPVIIADSVNPLTGKLNDLSFLALIQRKSICIIDDSHGIGITGNNGKGATSYMPANENIEYIICYSLSKAFNLNGGAISTNNTNFATAIRRLPAYTASTAISPALMYAFLKGESLYDAQRSLLKKNIDDFNEMVASKKSISVSFSGLPVFVFTETVDENELLTKGIIISSFAYPDPKGKKIQRIVINALHTKEDLQYLADAIP